MKKIILSLLLGIISANLYAQTFRVQSMVELTHDLSARISPRLDASGNECALIRLNIPSIKDAVFESPIVGKPSIEPGEYTVYVPSNSKDIQFTCDGQSIKVVFSDYQITIQPKTSYRIVFLKNSPMKASGRIEVIVSANYDDDVLLVDGIPMGQLPLVLDDIETGPHTFAVPNTMGRVQKDTIINVSEELKSIILFLKTEEPQKVKVTWMQNTNEGMYGDGDGVLWGITIEKHGDKMGLYDYCGETLVPPIYDYIDPWDLRLGYKFISVYKKDETGKSRPGYYCLGKGEVIACGTKMYYIRPNEYDLLSVWNDSIYRIVDARAGNTIGSGISYDREHTRVINKKYIIRRNKQGDWEITNMYGVVVLITVPYNDDDIVDYDPDGGWAVRQFYKGSDRWCFAVHFRNGEVRYAPSQYMLLRATNKLFAVMDKRTRKIGYLNINMEEVIPAIYKRGNDDDLIFSHGTIRLRTAANEYVVYNDKGYIVAQTIPGGNLSYIDKLGNGYILCETRDGQFGVIDSVGKIVVPFSYDSIGSDGNNSRRLYFYKTDGQKKIMNGRTVLLPWGNYKTCWAKDDSTATGLTKQHLLMYKNGVCIVKIPVAENCYVANAGYISGNNTINSTNDDRLFLIKNNITKKCGFLSAKGELLTSCIYDDFSEIIDWEQVCKEFGSEDAKKEYIELFRAVTNRESASEGYGIICLGDRYGYIDVTGKVVVPMIYKAATPFINGKAFVCDQNNKWTKIYSKDLK